MDPEIVIKERVLDSRAALNGDSSQPLIELKNSINDVVGVCLIAATVPYTYYVINSSNNQFALNELETDVDTLITVPPQTLNAENIESVLRTAITDSAGAGIGDHYNFFVDNTSSQLVMYSTVLTGDDRFEVSTAGPGPLNSIAAILGFEEATSYLSKTQATLGYNVYDNDGTQLPTDASIIIFPLAVELSGPSQIYVHCRYVGAAMGEAIGNDTNAADILGDFRLNAYFQERITYDNQAPVMFDCPIQSVRKMHLYLTTGTNTTPLDLNGGYFQIKVRFFCRKKQIEGKGVDLDGNRNVSTVVAGGVPQLRSWKRPRIV